MVLRLPKSSYVVFNISDICIMPKHQNCLHEAVRSVLVAYPITSLSEAHTMYFWFKGYTNNEKKRGGQKRNVPYPEHHVNPE